MNPANKVMIEIKTICVRGAGTMGSGIAQTAAAAGFETILYDVNEKGLSIANEAIEKGLNYLVKKGRITPAKKIEIQKRVRFTNDIYKCRAEIIIEAIVEK